MTYDIKNVFYLDTNFDIPAAQAAGSERGRTLDISAYIDPVAKGRAKGVGLAIYKVHFDWSEEKGNGPVGPTEDSAGRAALVVGDMGFTNTPADVAQAELALCAANQNLVAGQDFFGPVYASTAGMYENTILSPSIQVPYIAVRDTLNLVWGNGITPGELENNISVRLECAQISLGTDVLNQLLRTQTV
jgi:hypothetical protein